MAIIDHSNPYGYTLGRAEYVIPSQSTEQIMFWEDGHYIAGQGGYITPGHRPAPNANFFEVELMRRIGINPHLLPEGEVFTLTGYLRGEKDSRGRWVLDDEGVIMGTFVQWTADQQEVIDVMWPYIRAELKIG